MTSVEEHFNMVEQETKETSEYKDFALCPVQDFEQCMKNIPYEDIRKTLYHKYNLHVYDCERYNHLYMITYEQTRRRKGVHLNREEQRLVDEYRGVICEKGSNKVVCYTFRKMYRKIPREWNIEHCTVTQSYDGSQIKLFHYNNEWIVSTTRYIDASKVKFFTSSYFHTLFHECLGLFDMNKLDTRCCYSFVISHPNNRIVSRHKEPTIVHVLTRNMETFELVDHDLGVPKPRMFSFDSFQEIYNRVKKLPWYHEGFVIQHGNTDQFVKIVNHQYQFVKELRGNHTSLLYHFYELMKSYKTDLFLKYFPEYGSYFEEYQKQYQNLCYLIYTEYINVNLRKILEHKDCLPFLKGVIYRLHKYHLEKKKPVTLHVVIKHMEIYTPYTLWRFTEEANKLPWKYY